MILGREEDKRRDESMKYKEIRGKRDCMCMCTLCSNLKGKIKKYCELKVIVTILHVSLSLSPSITNQYRVSSSL